MLFSTNKIIWLQTVSSTNDYLGDKLLNKDLIKEGTVVVAREQTSGKGMAENAWISEPGKNLTFAHQIKNSIRDVDNGVHTI